MRTVLLLAVLLSPASATHQIRQDFSGRWIAVQPESVAGHELHIEQDGSALTLEQVRLDSRQVYDAFGRRLDEAKGVRESTTYRWDGKPVIAARGAAETQQVRSSARWDRNRLVLSDVNPDTGVRFQRTLALDQHGRLVVERRRQHVGHEPEAASLSVLEPVRIVYERR